LQRVRVGAWIGAPRLDHFRSADGIGITELAQRYEVSRPTVALWRRRWRESGLAGLQSELRPGRPRSIDDEQVAELIATTLHSKPPEATHWSVRTLAAESGIDKTAHLAAIHALPEAVRLTAFRLAYPSPWKTRWIPINHRR
jgi:transposase-like protein